MWIRKFDAFMNILAQGASLVASGWVFVIMIFICVDVICRYFFLSPIIGTPEIVQNSIASLAILMIPWATFLEQHVRSTMIRDYLPKIGRCVIDVVSYIIGAAVFAIIVYASIRPALHATSIRDFQGEGLRVPIYPVWWIIIFGGALSFYQCISQIVRAVLDVIRGERKVEPAGGHGGQQA